MFWSFILNWATWISHNICWYIDLLITIIFSCFFRFTIWLILYSIDWTAIHFSEFRFENAFMRGISFNFWWELIGLVGIRIEKMIVDRVIFTSVGLCMRVVTNNFIISFIFECIDRVLVQTWNFIHLLKKISYIFIFRS